MRAELSTRKQALSPARLAAIRAGAARVPGTPAGRAIADLLAEVDRIAAPPTNCPLSAASLRVLARIASGDSVEECAATLCISHHTVKSQLKIMKRKAKAISTPHLVALAFGNGWLTRHDITPGRDHR